MKTAYLVLIAVLLGACSTMQPPRYSVSADNVQQLKQMPTVSGEFVSFAGPASFSSNCRLMGPIEPADGLTIPQFITKAFNDELKMADRFNPAGAQVSGEVTNVEFSSISGLTNGYWDIGITLTSSNGKSLEVNNKYEFKSGFDAVTACNATADALSAAVQDLISATINTPGFSALF